MFQRLFDKVAIRRGYVPASLYRADRERLKRTEESLTRAEREVETLRDLFLQLQAILRDVQREARKTPAIPFAKVSTAPGLEPGRDYSVEVVFTNGVFDPRPKAEPEGEKGADA